MGGIVFSNSPFQRLDGGEQDDGIRPEEAAPKVAPGIAGDDRIKNISPAVSAVNVAGAQGAALKHAELVEQEQNHRALTPG